MWSSIKIWLRGINLGKKFDSQTVDTYNSVPYNTAAKMKMFGMEVNEKPDLEALAKVMMRIHNFKSVRVLPDEGLDGMKAAYNLRYYPMDEDTFSNIICAMYSDQQDNEITFWLHREITGQWIIYSNV